MTVSANVSRVTFAGDDVTTSFDLGSTFIFFDDTDLVVEVVTDATGASEELTLNVDYTVSGGDGATGTVDLSGGSSPHGALVSDTTLVVRRVLPITQTDDYVNGAISDAEVIEDRVDRLTMIAQQLDDESARALRASPTEDEIDPLPTRAARRNKFFKFDDTSDAKPEAVAVSELGTGLVLDEDDFASDSASDAPSQQSVNAHLAANYTKDSDTDVSSKSWTLDEDDFASDSATKVPTQQSAKAYVDNTTNALLSGFLYGCTLSNNGTDSDHDLDIAAGKATLEDGAGNNKAFTASAITKQIDANWAEGDDAGGFPSGLTLATDTTYHVFLIGKDDGTVDAGFDTNLSASNLLTDASSYSWFRRIGSLYTDGSSNLVGFTQEGDEFLLNVPVGDYANGNPGTSAVLVSLSVPSGIKVRAFMSFVLADTSPTAVTNLLLTSPDQTDTAPTNTVMTLHLNNTDSSEEGSGTTYTRTNTSSQIRFRLDQSTADHFFRETTLGWIDTRGRMS